MMSASEGGGGSWKSGHSKGGCVNCILQISSKCGQGGEGVKKSENFADVINGSPLRLCRNFQVDASFDISNQGRAINTTEEGGGVVITPSIVHVYPPCMQLSLSPIRKYKHVSQCRCVQKVNG